MATKKPAADPVAEQPAPTPVEPSNLAERAAAALADSDRAEFVHNGQKHVAVRDADGAIYVENRGQ